MRTRARWALVAVLLTSGAALSVLLAEDRKLDESERDYVAFVDESTTCFERARGIYATEDELVQALGREDWFAAERAVRRHRRILTRLANCVGVLADTGDPELDEAVTGVADALRVRVVADDFYVQGFKTGDVDVIERGDEHDRRARVEVSRAFERLNEIGRAHRPEIRDHIDVDRMRRLARPLGEPA